MNREYPLEFIEQRKRLGSNRVLDIEIEGAPHGISPDCPNCGWGEGTIWAYITKGLPPSKYPTGMGKPAKWIPEMGGWIEGDLMGLPCPVCSTDSQMNYLRDNCGLHEDDLNVRLDELTAYSQQKEAIEVAGQLLSMTPHPFGFVTFHGEYGTGKSTMLKVLVNGFRVAGVMSVYTNASDMLGTVRETFGDNTKGATETLIRDYKNVQVLAFDELDKVNITPWVQEVLHRLIDARYTDRGRVLTIFACNAEPARLRAEFQYVASRMSEGKIVHITGSDIRPALGRENYRLPYKEID